MVVQAPDFDALVARVQAVEREIASQEVQMNAVRYRAEQAEQQVARLRKFAEFIKNERREQWHRWADEADDPAPTDNEIETFDEQFREACKALRETGAYQEVKKTT